MSDQESSIHMVENEPKGSHSAIAEWFEAREEDASRLWGRVRHPRRRGQFPQQPEQRLAWTDAWRPDVDIFEQGDDVVLAVSLPGVRKEDITVTLDAGRLVIRGERSTEQEVKDQDYHWLERSYGSFYRVLPVPAEITPDQVTAALKEGDLRIRLPKAAFVGSGPSRIAVT
ncbi:MAG TPA: Hsp20/alpha crystallin family protein [Chloroflexota bacterium]|nr:Hsp20/alpha crystallin family protein [Chloroflexota bacterium]